MSKNDNQIESQNKDFEYVARLADEMKRSSPHSYDDEPAPAADLDRLAAMIDIEPGFLGSMDESTMDIINEIKRKSDARDVVNEDPYSSALRFGESFLGLDDDDEPTTGSKQWSLTPRQVIDGIEDALHSLRDNTKAGIRVGDGRRVKDVIISNGEIVLMLE